VCPLNNVNGARSNLLARRRVINPVKTDRDGPAVLTDGLDAIVAALWA
jgi:hypothetical protein